MTAVEMLFAGYCLATGIVMGWLWASAPLKRKVNDLENLVKWETAKAAAAESDLARVRAKLEILDRETKKA